MSGVISVAAVIACATAMMLADLRWLRVAQREHYLAGSVSRFTVRWWRAGWRNKALCSIAVAAFVVASILSAAVFVVAGVVILGPIGLSLRGRTAKLIWTQRLRRLALTLGITETLILAITLAWVGDDLFWIAWVVLLVPVFVDFAMAVNSPIEQWIGKKFVDQAKVRLQAVHPIIVGITGSYGKTTTKNYVARLLTGTRSVFATPASFNNRAGISRAVNEHLTQGTEVFVAEMGTYGQGEIASLCQLAPPDIAVLTAIGPVHLERFGSETAIIKAKSEIFETAQVAVINVDDDRLDELATSLHESGKSVWRCSSTKQDASVLVSLDGQGLQIRYDGVLLFEGHLAVDAAPTNVACAIAVALELGVSSEVIAARLADLPVVPHRLEVSAEPGKPAVIDDTYNANPASVRRALDRLALLAPDGRRVVVTPGLVELGRRQCAENTAFAKAAVEVATDIIVVGRTNRRSLLGGASEGSSRVLIVDHLGQAVDWVRDHVVEGDAVLYANDLPDHFP